VPQAVESKQPEAVLHNEMAAMLNQMPSQSLPPQPQQPSPSSLVRSPQKEVTRLARAEDGNTQQPALQPQAQGAVLVTTNHLLIALIAVVVGLIFVVLLKH
jgi:hypothetical protein